MLLKLKLIAAALIDFVRQIGLRTPGNNLRRLLNAVDIILTRQPTNEQYITKHRLTLDALRRLVTLPVADTAEELAPTTRVWTMWWQGEQQMPPVVRATYNSIRQAAGTHPTVLITKDNYKQWVTLPAWIERGWSTGRIGLAHLSDIIRVTLLDDYGGLWIDSTIYCSQPLPEAWLTRRFFTVKDPGESCRYASRGVWNMQVLGSSYRHYPLFRLLRLTLESYWQHHTTAVDYLFFDSLVGWLLDENDSLRADLDALPLSNHRMHQLLPLMNTAYDAALLPRWADEGTTLYKLTYKAPYTARAADGQPTFYGHITEQYSHGTADRQP